MKPRDHIVAVPPPPGPPPELGRCAVGDVLCRLYALSEERWPALPEGDRPTTAEHVPGPGWVVATPGRVGPDPA